MFELFRINQYFTYKHRNIITINTALHYDAKQLNLQLAVHGIGSGTLGLWIHFNIYDSDSGEGLTVEARPLVIATTYNIPFLLDTTQAGEVSLLLIEARLGILPSANES